jgi:hypothetical protein
MGCRDEYGISKEYFCVFIGAACPGAPVSCFRRFVFGLQLQKVTHRFLFYFKYEIINKYDMKSINYA